jgi:hypothetical protein
MNELALFIDFQGAWKDDLGVADFSYSDGTPFKFIIDYAKRKIYCEFVPLDWETMYFDDEDYKPVISQDWQKIIDARILGDKL